MPFQFLFEGISPFIELLGYAITIFSFFMGLLSYEALFAFLFLAFGIGYMITFITILIEELLFNIYPKKKHVLILCLAAIAENFGYRQMNALWRCEGLINWLRNKEGIREMPRLNNWQTPN